MSEQNGTAPDGRPPGSQRGRRRAVPGGRRHQARILALQILYEVDITDHGVAAVIAHTFADQEAPPALQRHVERLVHGVLDHRAELDPIIAEAAPAFPVDQLPAIDRNVLRLAIYELRTFPDVPFKAVINEAVELAKRFGGASSGRFVNGVLGTVVARFEHERNPADHDQSEPDPPAE